MRMISICAFLWCLASCSKSGGNGPETEPPISNNYLSVQQIGYTIKYRSTMSLSDPETAAVFKELVEQLDSLRNYIPYKDLSKIQAMPVWLDEKDNSPFVINYWAPSATPGPDYAAKKGNIEIADLAECINRIKHVEPGLLVSQFALLYYHTLNADALQRVQDAFNAAQTANLYKSVNQKTQTGTVTGVSSPATQSAEWYFAKLSEAYFSQSDFAPYDYDALKAYDLTGFNLMLNIWGVRRVKQYKPVVYHGFTVMVNESDLSNDLVQEALSLMEHQFKTISDSVRPEILSVMQARPLWIQPNESTGASFNPGKEYLLTNGLMPEMAYSVEVTNVANFVAWVKVNQPWIIFHELSHYVHYHFVGWDNPTVRAAYQNALSKGLYKNVDHMLPNGSIVNEAQGYALQNEKEYVAELTEAYYVKNDFFPFVRQELKDYDPVGYDMIKRFWGGELKPLN